MHTPVRYKLAEHPGDDSEAGGVAPKAGPAKLHPLSLTRDRDRERRGGAEDIAVPVLPPPTSWTCRWTPQQLPNNQQQATSPQASDRGIGTLPTPTRAAACQSPQRDTGGEQGLRRSRSCPLVATFAAVPSSGEVAVQVTCCPGGGTAATEGTADTGSWVPPTNRSWLPPSNTEGSLSPPCAGNRAPRTSSAVIPTVGVGNVVAAVCSGPPALAQPRRLKSCGALVQTGVTPRRQLSSRCLQSCSLATGPDSARPGGPAAADAPRQLSRHSVMAPRRALVRQGGATAPESTANMGARKLGWEPPAPPQHLQQQQQRIASSGTGTSLTRRSSRRCMLQDGSLVVPRETHHEQPVANPRVEVPARHGVQAPREHSSSSMRLEKPSTAAPLRPELQSARGLSFCEQSCSSSAHLERPAVAGVVGNSSMTAVIATLRPELLSARQGRPPSFDQSRSSSCLVDRPVANTGTRVPALRLESARASSRQGRTATTLTRSTSSSSLERPPGGLNSLHVEQIAGGGLPSCQRSCSSSCPLQRPAPVAGNMSQSAAAMTSRPEMPAWQRGPPSCDRSCSPSCLLERSGAKGGTRIAACRLEQPNVAGQLGKATAGSSCLERPPMNALGGHFLEGLATSPVERSESRPCLQTPQICNLARSCSPPHPRVALVHQTSLATPVERAPSPQTIKHDSSYPRLEMPKAALAVDHSANYSRVEVLVPRTNDRSARVPRAELAGMARPAGGAPPPSVRSSRVLSLRRD